MGKKIYSNWTSPTGERSGLAVEQYSIPKPVPEKQSGQYYTSFQKTTTGISAGSASTWIIFSSFINTRVVIQSIEVNALRTDSTGVPQTLNKISMTLSSTIGGPVKSPGLSVLPFRTGGVFTDMVNTSITWQGPPDNTQIYFDGPYVLETTCSYSFQAVANANFLLNDRLVWSCVIKWTV